jgi:hypothetical protein
LVVRLITTVSSTCDLFNGACLAKLGLLPAIAQTDGDVWW